MAPVCRRWADLVRQSHTRLFLDCNAPRGDHVGWWDVPTRVSSLLAAVAARRQRLTGLSVSNSRHNADCWGILGFFILGGMPALTTVELAGGPPKVGARCQPNGLGSAPRVYGIGHWRAGGWRPRIAALSDHACSLGDHACAMLPTCIASPQMLFAAHQLRRLSLSPTMGWPAEVCCLVNLRQLVMDRMRCYLGSGFCLPASITQLRQLEDFSSCCSDWSGGREKLRVRGLWRLQQLPALRRVAVGDAVMADLTWVEVRRPGTGVAGQPPALCSPGCPLCAGCGSLYSRFCISPSPPMPPCVCVWLSCSALHCRA